MGTALMAPELGDAEFRRVAELVYRIAGIMLPPGKEGLVRARLAKRLRAINRESFVEYLEHVSGGSAEGKVELAEMIDAITTNKTNFFREPAHFAYLREVILPARAPRSSLAIWSAGCSTGEEPYTVAMVLRDALGEGAAASTRMLATDISAKVLTRARAGVYNEEAMSGVPDDVVRRHFARRPDQTGPGGNTARTWQVLDRVQAMVKFARLNLMGDWPMHGPFDVIFCRNVMIYFDRATQERLVGRFWELLAPGGHLFVGHSESLSAHRHEFAYVQPAVYVRT